MTGETHSENGPLSFKIPKWISGRWEEKGLELEGRKRGSEQRGFWR